jgi:hypothetical protein
VTSGAVGEQSRRAGVLWPSPVNEPQGSLFESRTAAIAYAGILLLVVVVTYGPVFAYPYVQDDLGAVDFVRTHSGIDALRGAFDPAGRLFYRPLSICYYIPVVRTFGLEAVGFHSGAMLLLSLGAWMVARVIFDVVGDRIVALGTGLLYAAASPIHLDTMTWMVGANDLFGMLAALLTLWLFHRSRHVAGGIALLAGLLFKEAVVFVPLLLLVYCACRGGRWSWRKAVLSSLPYGAAIAVFLVPKVVTRLLLALPEAHPYSVHFAGASVLENARSYARWCYGALFPMFAEKEWGIPPFAALLRQHALFLAGGAVLVVAAAVWLVRGRPRFGFRLPSPSVLILTAWIPLGLLPVAFLPHHAYRYYLTYSLPPLIALFLLLLKAVTERRGQRPRLAVAAVGLWVAISLPFSVRFFHRRAFEGLEQTCTDGTNFLFQRGAIARIVRSGLMERRPSLPPGSTLIFQDVLTAAFQGDRGVRVWLDDPTAQVFEARDVARDERGLFVEEGPGLSGLIRPRPPRGRIDLDPARTFVFVLRDGALHDVTAEFLAARGITRKEAAP